MIGHSRHSTNASQSKTEKPIAHLAYLVLPATQAAPSQNQKLNLSHLQITEV